MRIVRIGDVWLENRQNMLESLDQVYPDRLEFNVKAEFYLPEGHGPLTVPKERFEILPGNRFVDLLVRVNRSGKDIPSIESDLARLEAFFDALSFSELGKAIEVRPRLRGATTSIRSPLDDERITQALEVLDSLESLPEKERNSLGRALKWYRESFRARSIFNQFSMLWNCLEIVATQHGGEGTESRTRRLEVAKSYLKKRGESLRLEDLVHVHNNIVQASIRNQMTRGFRRLFGKDADVPVGLCFGRVPEEERLWRIRNDINHGNIVESSLDDRTRVTSALSDLFRTTWNSASKALNLAREIRWNS